MEALEMQNKTSFMQKFEILGYNKAIRAPKSANLKSKCQRKSY